jgi:hypothetical protein
MQVILKLIESQANIKSGIAGLMGGMIRARDPLPYSETAGQIKYQIITFRSQYPHP